MDVDTAWQHTHEQRRELARLLAGLDEEAWAAPSVCPGWTVRDVAAHVISVPQMTWGPFLRACVRGGFWVPRVGLLEGRRRGRAEIAAILEQYERYDGSRVSTPFTGHLESLMDVLVHVQDIVRPLGLRHDAPPEASAAAAGAALRLGVFFGRPRLGGVRLVATDVAWSHGQGPEVRAPMVELLLLCTGRSAAAAQVEGEGRSLVRLA
ncbi:maleylpyruvate isomerase family mycothiol-dependent enzyme [Pimelobacter simplex]|uniref:maleylpyruvate isomerase family mycothiol-dependent enzyme n=1 Tax=Nocardioides simplex TaxID=2045 RepID=UPI0019334E65|nr:maleylpyruvate isomerase family mycothiol-dependent enzyme [Pimelobacter simplex]